MPDVNIANHILAITRTFLTETASPRALQAITLNAHLERDLGIDSLAKVELVYRIENTLDIRLSTAPSAEADTLNDLANAVSMANHTKEYPISEFVPALGGGPEIDVSESENVT